MLSTIWNTILYQPIHNLVTYLYILTGSIGLSTFLLILFVRGFLLAPLASKQQKDTKKIRSIQPRLEELKEKYKNDPKGLTEAQQKVYKEINYNPVGCLTNFLIQIPIYIAIYQSVLSFTKPGVTPLTMEGLYPFVADLLKATGQTVFATDLFGIELFTSPGSIFSQGIFTAHAIPYIVLIVLFALSNILPTLITQKVMGAQVPKAQKKGTSQEGDMQEALAQSINQSTLYVMPIMLTVTMIPLPSIVHVYMIINGIISITQQLLIKSTHDKELQQKLYKVLTGKYKLGEEYVRGNMPKLLKLPGSINFLADELGEFGEFKTTSVKVNSTPFATVLKKVKNEPVLALLTFAAMAKDLDHSEEILAQAGK